MNKDHLLEQALSYAKAGYSIFPCAQDKSPLTKHGFKDATTDLETIKQWFSKESASLIGLVTGPSNNIGVIDIDRSNDGSDIDGFTWLEANEDLLSETRMVRSQSGGLHFYYRNSEGLKCSNSAVHKCVDIKADGGYIIAGGHGYEILIDMPLNQLPPFPMEIFTKTASLPDSTPTLRHDLSKIYEPNQWQNTVRDWTGGLIGRGVDQQTILEFAPLITLPDFPVEQTQAELKTFIEGAIKKGYAPEKSLQNQTNFKLKHYDQLKELEDPVFIVKDILVDNSFAMIFGATGSFKSTVILDMCVCIQHGIPWQGKKTEQRNVAFFSHEDGSGFKKRFLAAVERYSIEDPVIYWDSQVPNLLDQKNLDHYIDELRTHEIGLVVIDTFAYAVAGAEENSSKEMGIAIDSILRMRDSIEGTILIIHHSGKNADRGARGSSAIKSAADTEIKIAAEEKEIDFISTKQRNFDKAKTIYLKAEVVQIEKSTACVVKLSGSSPYRGGGHGLRGQKLIAWNILENLFTQNEEFCEESDYIGSLERNNLFTRKQKKSASFKKASQRVIEEFEERKLIGIKDGKIFMTEKGRESIETKKFWEGFNKEEE